MRVSIKYIGLAVMALSLGACGDSGFGPDDYYVELSEATQVEYMAEVVSILNTKMENTLSSAPIKSIPKIVYTGDTERDLITSTGIYSKVVTPEQLEEVRAIFSKKDAQNPPCYQDYVLALTMRGIGLQTIVKDPNGTVIYESETCEGITYALRPYGEQTEAQQAITMTKLIKVQNALHENENQDPKSVSNITLSGDSIKDKVYVKVTFKGKLSSTEIQLFKDEHKASVLGSKKCLGDDAAGLNALGINYEYRAVDYLGDDIVPPIVCLPKMITRKIQWRFRPYQNFADKPRAVRT